MLPGEKLGKANETTSEWSTQAKISSIKEVPKLWRPETGRKGRGYT
jgi:hypothetical protein